MKILMVDDLHVENQDCADRIVRFIEEGNIVFSFFNGFNFRSLDKLVRHFSIENEKNFFVAGAYSPVSNFISEFYKNDGTRYPVARGVGISFDNHLEHRMYKDLADFLNYLLIERGLTISLDDITIITRRKGLVEAARRIGISSIVEQEFKLSEEEKERTLIETLDRLITEPSKGTNEMTKEIAYESGIRLTSSNPDILFSDLKGTFSESVGKEYGESPKIITNFLENGNLLVILNEMSNASDISGLRMMKDLFRTIPPELYENIFYIPGGYRGVRYSEFSEEFLIEQSKKGPHITLSYVLDRRPIVPGFIRFLKSHNSTPKNIYGTANSFGPDFNMLLAIKEARGEIGVFATEVDIDNYIREISSALEKDGREHSHTFDRLVENAPILKKNLYPDFVTFAKIHSIGR